MSRASEAQTLYMKLECPALFFQAILDTLRPTVSIVVQPLLLFGEPLSGQLTHIHIQIIEAILH